LVVTQDISKVRAALETALKAVDPNFATQWENFAFDPTPGTPYQACNILFADPFDPEANGSFVQESGYMQVTLRYPANKGAGPAITKAQELKQAFRKGLSIPCDGSTVQIIRTASIAPGSNDGDRYAVAVKIFFNASGNS
jgi:hypothetical protein